jgi:uncharacterized membrane protein YdfJ with MMPL/SSD domain
MSADEADQPLLRVVRGDPTADELAALVAVLVAVLAARAAGPAAAALGSRTAWNDPARLVREPLHPRPGGWRGSALPR